MINENIKRYRKAKGLSQEEVAVHLNVVRQTISKYESGLSVPDADMLIQLADLLEVPVSKILDIDNQDEKIDNLSNELERINKILAEKNKKERLNQQANKVRGYILLFSFVSLILAYAIENTIIAIILTGLCIVSVLYLLYRNLALLTKITTDTLNIKTLKITTIFDIILIIICIGFALFAVFNVIPISEQNERYVALAIVSSVIIFSGLISPRLPYNRHTGLRLPWTVQDEDTWNVAHRVLGIVAIPIAIFYLVGAMLFKNFEIITLVVMFFWIGVPAITSLVFYYKKFHG